MFKLTYDSTSVRKLRFNLYDIPPNSKAMDDEDRMGSAMMVLKEVVDNAGIEFVYKLTHENPAKQQALLKNGATIIIQCSSKSEMALDMAPTSPTAATASQLSADEGVRKLQTLLLAGDVFTFHYSARDPQQRFLFFSTTAAAASSPSAASSSPPSPSSRLGSLYWCDVGSRVQDPSASIALADIRSVTIGKKATSEFSTYSLNENCFTINTDGQQIDVECRTSKQRNEWTQAIIGILKAAQHNVRVEEVA